MVGLYAIFHFITGSLHPVEAFKGGFKGVSHFLLGLSVATIVALIFKIPLIFKLIGWILFILSIDIITPPYGIDIESLFAIPLASHFKASLNWSLGLALTVAYAIVFAIAIAYVLLWWFYLRKKV